MTSRPQSFVALSSALTGFSRVRIHGTGMTETYLDELDVILPDGFLDRLIDAFSTGGEDALNALLDDPDLGPVARQLTLLWYTGTWTALPEDWRQRNGASARDTTHVVSPASYQAGLQWAVVNAHPAGSRQQGFGFWSTAPAELVG